MKESIPIYVHGLRNETAEFEGGQTSLFVDEKHAGDSDAIVLTIEGTDRKTNRHLDIEVAVPVEHIDQLIQLLISRRQPFES